MSLFAANGKGGRSEIRIGHASRAGDECRRSGNSECGGIPTAGGALVASGTATITADTGNGGEWQDLIGGETGDVKPVEFAALLAAKKSLGISFGSACRWASGVAVKGGGGTFKLLSYTIE